LTGRTAGTGAELTGDNPHLNVPNQAMAKLPVPGQSLRVQERSVLSGLVSAEPSSGRGGTTRQNRRGTKRGETMEVEEKEANKA